MPRSPGTGFVLGGLALLFFMLFAYTPLLNAVQPCAWYDPGCGATRWLLWWVLVLGSLAVAGVGISMMLFGQKQGLEMARAGGARGLSFAGSASRAGVGYAKRGGRYARDRYRARRR